MHQAVPELHKNSTPMQFAYGLIRLCGGTGGERATLLPVQHRALPGASSRLRLSARQWPRRAGANAAAPRVTAPQTRACKAEQHGSARPALRDRARGVSTPIGNLLTQQHILHSHRLSQNATRQLLNPGLLLARQLRRHPHWSFPCFVGPARTGRQHRLFSDPSPDAVPHIRAVEGRQSKLRPAMQPHSSERSQITTPSASP